MSERIISVGRPVYKNGRYEIPFEVPEELGPYFRDSCYWFECPDVEEIPDPLAVVPVVSSLISFAWVFDCIVCVDAIDEAYAKALPKIKEAYRNMLPKLELKGGLSVGKVVPCDKSEPSGSPLLLYSGGVDAWTTLIRHIDERPRLVTIWGADIRVDDARAWDLVYSYTKTVASEFDLPCSYVRANFRSMFNYRALNRYLLHLGTGYEWWRELQHGMAFLGLVAPLGYASGAPIAYIASSYSYDAIGSYTCASDPSIDNEFAAGSIRGFHDGFELLRQDKVNQIVEFSKTTTSRINLRVCFHIDSGENCCLCEKCGRTILGIYAAGEDPHRFGFDYSTAKLRLLAFRMHWFYVMDKTLYKRVRDDAAMHPGSVPSCFNWFFKGDLGKVCNNGFKQRWGRFHAFGARIYHKLIGR